MIVPIIRITPPTVFKKERILHCKPIVHISEMYYYTKKIPTGLSHVLSQYWYCIKSTYTHIRLFFVVVVVVLFFFNFSRLELFSLPELVFPGICLLVCLSDSHNIFHKVFGGRVGPHCRVEFYREILTDNSQKFKCQYYSLCVDILTS